MTSRAVIDLYCDGGPSIGLGHVRRTLAIADRLRAAGIEPRVRALSRSIEHLLPEPQLNGADAPVVFFDAPFEIENYIFDARSNNKTTVTLDWFGDVQPDVNIVVFPHQQPRASKSVFVGFDFVIIRDEILALRSAIASTMESNANVIVCLGGADVHNQGALVASEISNHGYAVTLVRGPLNKSPAPKDAKYEIVENPPNFAELLATCDWAVTNAGGCLFEAMFLEKAAIALPQTEREERIASFALENGAILGTSLDVLHGVSSRLYLTKRQPTRLVDGLGLDRIVGILKEQF